jgi:hypothetical protein
MIFFWLNEGFVVVCRHMGFGVRELGITVIFFIDCVLKVKALFQFGNWNGHRFLCIVYFVII